MKLGKIFEGKDPISGKTRNGPNSAKLNLGLFGLPKQYQILVFSGIGAITLIFIGVMLTADNMKLRGALIGLGIIVGFVPYSLYTYVEKRRTLDMENKFPLFLRDLAEAQKTGLTLPQAVYKGAEIDYGELSPEVKKMSSQISWGIPFNEVLRRFSDRVKSQFIGRAVSIIVNAQMSGGAMMETLDSVADDAALVKELEKDRKTRLNQQVTIMYAIYFLFIAIVIALQRLMIPLITSRGFSLSAEDPEEILAFFRNLFFSMIVIQGAFNGLIAGQIGDGSMLVGLKHSAIFVVVGIIVSIMFLF